MHRHHHVTVEVISRADMIAAVERFYLEQTPGDDRDPEVIKEIHSARPLPLLTMYRQIDAATGAKVLQDKLRRRLRWAVVAFVLYAIATGLNAVRLMLSDPRGDFAAAIGTSVFVLVLLAVTAYVLASRAVRFRK